MDNPSFIDDFAMKTFIYRLPRLITREYIYYLHLPCGMIIYAGTHESHQLPLEAARGRMSSIESQSKPTVGIRWQVYHKA
jgi:hypothetical protein